ncbi:MAG TPA: TPM domain-containing protein, partial [Chthoniobacterales bacterium]|nr:TPM domain-containing protein [Chthoniobacterales bacterium]
MKRIAFCLAAFVAVHSQAAEDIPPKPAAYFNDYAGVVSKEAANRFNEQLAQFERETSNQVVVAIWQTMPSQSSIEDFTQRTFQAWTVGQKGQNNGAVLFVFVKDRRMRIQPGYGLEGVLPDFTCDQIIRN